MGDNSFPLCVPLCAVNYWSYIDLVDTFLHIFVSITISEHEGQKYFAINMKDYHIK